MKKENTKAFPIVSGHDVYSTGMDLRDWFAGQALMGLISAGRDDEFMEKGMSEIAYSYADAMMKERKND